MYKLPSNGTSQDLCHWLCVFVFTLKGSYITVHEQKTHISKSEDHVISKGKGCGYRHTHIISILSPHDAFVLNGREPIPKKNCRFS